MNKDTKAYNLFGVSAHDRNQKWEGGWGGGLVKRLPALAARVTAAL